MSNVIKLKRGTSTPSTSDIASGEVAIDTSAQKLYINDSGTVKEIGGGAGTGEQFVKLETAAGAAANNGSNTIAGYESGLAISDGSDNTFYGQRTGKAVNTGDFNCAFGSEALKVNTDGGSNVAVGASALTTNESGGGNVAVGKDALRLYTGDSATALGFEALESNSTGTANTAVGYRAADAVTTGSQNVCVGMNAGGAMVGGHWNVIIGKDCLASGDTNGSVIIGLDAANGATGDNNVFIGRGACDGTATTSDNCIVIGYGADPSSTSTDNEITLGNTSITKFRIPGLNFSLKDTTATDNYVLTVDANGDCGWEAASGTTINNNADNRIITGSGTANTLEAESSLTWSGTAFTSSGAFNVNSGAGILLSTTNAYLMLDSDQMIKINSEQATEIQVPTLEVKNQADNETMAKFVQNGSCYLYHDNSLKLQTTSSGLTVSGTCTATTFSGSGASLTNLPADSTKLSLSGGTMTGNVIHNDSAKIFLGSDSDYSFWHDGTNAWHKCETGNLEFKTYGGSAGNLNFESAGSSTFKVNENTTALTLASNGNATFGGDVIFTGDAANLTWDKSTDDLIFNDNAKAIFGTSSDGLEIHHDGSNSFIDETGTGILYIRSSSTIRLSDISGNNMILCEDGGETQLFHNGTEKLNTSSGGVTVSGTCTATAFSGDGSALTNISAGKVGQVVSTTKTSTFTHSSTDNWTDITGMSVSITPSSSSSKVLVLANTRVSCNNHANARLVRGSTAIAIGDADGSRSRTSVGELYDLGNAYRSMDSSIIYLDSPNTTSATTYKIQFIAGEEFYFNRTRYDTNSMGVGRPASTITVMEILA